MLCMKGNSLNATVYRGFAKARDLGRISEPNVFDQSSDPEGTQRARETWNNIKNEMENQTRNYGNFYLTNC